MPRVEETIFQYLVEVKAKLDLIIAVQAQQSTRLDTLELQGSNIAGLVVEVMNENTALAKQVQILVDDLGESGATPAGFAMSIKADPVEVPHHKFVSEVLKMNKPHATSVDFQLNDDGTATATLTTIDTLKNPIPFPAGFSVPVWASSDPSITVTAAADGMSATLTPAGTLSTAVSISATSSNADNSVTLTGSGLVDVVADANKPSGFAIAFN